METKWSESTINRPGGCRMIDGPVIYADLRQHTFKLKTENTWQKNDRNSITLFKSDQMTMTLIGLRKGAELKNNVVNGLLSLQVIEGTVAFFTMENDVLLQANQVINLRPYKRHSLLAIKDSFLLLTHCI